MMFKASVYTHIREELRDVFNFPLRSFGPGGAMREENMNTVTENDNQSKSRKYFWQMQSVKATKKEIKWKSWFMIFKWKSTELLVASPCALITDRSSDLNLNTETPGGARGREEEEGRRKEGVTSCTSTNQSLLLDLISHWLCSRSAVHAWIGIFQAAFTGGVLATFSSHTCAQCSGSHRTSNGSHLSLVVHM